MTQYRRTAKFEVPRLVTMNIHEDKGNVFARHAKTVPTRQNALYRSKWPSSEPDTLNSYLSRNLTMSSDSAVRV